MLVDGKTETRLFGAFDSEDRLVVLIFGSHTTSLVDKQVGRVPHP